MSKRENLVYNKGRPMTTPEKKAFMLKLFLDKNITLIEIKTFLQYFYGESKVCINLLE